MDLALASHLKTIGLVAALPVREVEEENIHCLQRNYSH
jgi:hypothetical protein